MIDAKQPIFPKHKKHSMIDTHTHLDGEEFAEDFEEVIRRANEAGVSQMLIPGINLTSLPQLIARCNQHPGVLHAMVGLHPEEINPSKIDIETTLNELYHLLKTYQQQSFYLRPDPASSRIVAIGEVGLDFYWDDQYKELQEMAFARQVEWALEFQLPLMIHCRAAHEEILRVLGKYRNEDLRGVFHCYTGTSEEAQALLDLPGFVLGIGGVSTFKKSHLPAVLSSTVPLSRIVLETDSPYMAPVPYRGKRNESAFVVEVARKLAEIYQISVEQVDSITTETATRIFAL